jgi:hypothetical protein
MRHDPKRGPWLINGRGGEAIDTTVSSVLTRTGSEPQVQVIDPKTKKVTRIPRRLFSHHIRSAR